MQKWNNHGSNAVQMHSEPEPESEEEANNEHQKGGAWDQFGSEHHQKGTDWRFVGNEHQKGRSPYDNLRSNAGGKGDHPHGVCPAPAEHFDKDQIGCPSDRTDSCVAGNRDYVTFAEAWAACGRIPECGAIMRWTSGNYYLRRRTDPMVAVAGAWSMYYDCKGSGVAPASGGSYSRMNEPTGACAPPMGPFDLPPKGCPAPFPGGCISGNQGYTTFAEAWEACGIIAECDIVMRWTPQGRYYLRRRTDPDLDPSASGVGSEAGCIEYACE